MVEEVQKILERDVTPKEFVMLQDLEKDYTEKDILYWVYMSKFKDRPIDYARVVIIKNCQKKNSSSGSEWWDNLKQTL